MAATDPTPAVPAAPPRPWWAALLTSALTTLFGLLLIIVAVVVVRPALDPSDSAIWIGLVLGGAGMMGVGGSLLGRAPAKAPDQRGRAAVHVLILALAAFVGAALVIGLATIASGCGGSQYAARRDAAVDWTPGPPCHIEVHLDGEKKPAVTVDAPEACEPPPDLCPVPAPRPQS